MGGRGKLHRRLKSWRWRAAAAAVLAVFLAFCALTLRLFVFPARGLPARVDAIVVLGGSGDRLDLGLQLAREDRAPYLVLSLGLPWVPPGICQQHVGPAQVICFHPDPDTTQGEAEGASQIAKQHGWQSIALVTTRDQVWRAHLRFERCYPGQIYGVGSAVPWYDWPHEIIYQWAGTYKAEITQRSCLSARFSSRITAADTVGDFTY
jgi:uncharacterized SAM-binding protein YcdF (DUF218 family)